MKTAWKRNTEYDLDYVCCRKLSLNPNIQKQNSKWYLFDNTPHSSTFWIIEHCPFCGRKLK